MVTNATGSMLVFKRSSNANQTGGPLFNFSGKIHRESRPFPVEVEVGSLPTEGVNEKVILICIHMSTFFSLPHCSRTPTTMMNEPKLHSIRAKVRRCRNNGNWPQQHCADPRHSSRQFSLISINSFPIHHTPQET